MNQVMVVKRQYKKRLSNDKLRGDIFDFIKGNPSTINDVAKHFSLNYDDAFYQINILTKQEYLYRDWVKGLYLYRVVANKEYQSKAKKQSAGGFDETRLINNVKGFSPALLLMMGVKPRVKAK